MLRSARVEGSAYAKKSARYESASQDYDQIEESQQIEVQPNPFSIEQELDEALLVRKGKRPEDSSEEESKGQQ